MDEGNRLTVIHGDALSSLRRLPAQSVQCCVTSPPYWGLRDYGLEPLVWDDTVECQHEWESHLQPSANGQTTHAMIAETLNESSATRKPKLSAFCHCGAWRGCLGLEPTPELYCQHIVQIFREVRRVLRNDGTLWLNLGDSYSGSGRGMNGDGSAGKAGAKQETNKGSRLDFHDKCVEAGAIGRYWVAPPPGLKQKDLVGIPWMVAFALRADGWWLRSDIIWSKPNSMPESVTDRPTRSHEYIFLLSKSARYFYDHEAIKEAGKNPADDVRRSLQQHENNKSLPDEKRNGIRQRGHASGDAIISPMANKRSVWTVPTKPFSGAHFAIFPPDLIRPCVLAGTNAAGVLAKTVLDPFAGSGTTGKVALELGRRAILIEPNTDYVKLIDQRTTTTMGLPLA